MAKTRTVQHETSDLIKQANPITTARYDLSALALKSFLLAYSKITPHDKEFTKYSFVLTDVAKLLGDEFGNTENLVQALRRLQRESIFIRDDGDYVSFIPLPTIRVSVKNNTVTFTLNPDLQPYFLDLRSQYTLFPVEHAFRLGGKYSIRLYQLVIQWQGKAGKTGTWVIELDISETRKMWGITENEYKLMSRFRIDVIERSVTEINSAQLGLVLTMLPPKRNGKNITHFVIQARKVPSGEPRSVNPEPATESEKKAKANRQKHPEKWQEFYDSDLAQERLFSIDRTQEAEDFANLELEKWLKEKSKGVKK